MLPMLSVVILAVAVSLDSFGVGMNYGLRRISIPFLSILIIAICSGTIMLLSMSLGSLLLPVIPSGLAGAIGGTILIVIGIWAFIQMLSSRSSNPSVDQEGEASTEKRTILYLELRRLGLVIEILRAPSKADVDRSGTISASEAALLGAALSLDAFGAGIGASFIGLSAWLTAPFIALFCGIFLFSGIRIGALFGKKAWMQRLSFLPGSILIMIGIMKLM